MKNAVGMIVLDENTPQVWVVSRSKQEGGYTFPTRLLKNPTINIEGQEKLIKETFELTGLQVKPLYNLADYTMEAINTHYFIGIKTGGDPTRFGYKSKAVKLVPIDKLGNVLVGIDKNIAEDFIAKYNIALKKGEGDVLEGFKILKVEDKSALELKSMIKSGNYKKIIKIAEKQYPNWNELSPISKINILKLINITQNDIFI